VRLSEDPHILFSQLYKRHLEKIFWQPCGEKLTEKNAKLKLHLEQQKMFPKASNWITDLRRRIAFSSTNVKNQKLKCYTAALLHNFLGMYPYVTIKVVSIK